MARTSIAVIVLVAATSALTSFMPAFAAPDVTATRLAQNPLITVDASASLGGNVNGPTVIRVPDWVERPLGHYYMYFANHMGTFVRLAYADAIAGPWTIYEPGVLHVRDTAFFRPQPDPVGNAGRLLHACRVAGDLRRHGAEASGDVGPRMVDERRTVAERSGHGSRLGATEAVRAVHASRRIG